MRKTKDGFQVLTALEKAERRLEEAIEYAKRESNQRNSESGDANKAVEDAMLEFKRVAMVEQSEQESQLKNNDKPIYGYNAELSRSDKIENSRADIADDKKALLESILGKDFHIEEEILLDDDLRNEEFHGGYDSLNKVATYNNALKAKRDEPLDVTLLNGSEDYELKCFNERNIFDGDCYEPEDIMPTNYYLSSFDDEDDKDIQPYEINKSLILGETVPPEFVDENLTEPLAASNEKLEYDNEQEKIEAQLSKEEALKEIQQEAEEILQKARINAQEIISNAQQEAEKIIAERVEQVLAEASEKGYSEGFEKGQNEGFLAAENAVNEGMIQEAAEFKNELKSSLQDFDEKKNEILQKYLSELADLTVNIAEKVIKISLKSSKDVVAKMIIAAAEDCRDKAWAKVYISHEDKAIAMNLEKGLIDALNQISSNVKVIVMEDEPSGTCIIETPDQIVDASVGPQLENIRQIVSDNKM